MRRVFLKSVVVGWKQVAQSAILIPDLDHLLDTDQTSDTAQRQGPGKSIDVTNCLPSVRESRPPLKPPAEGHWSQRLGRVIINIICGLCQLAKYYCFQKAFFLVQSFLVLFCKSGIMVFWTWLYYCITVALLWHVIIVLPFFDCVPCNYHSILSWVLLYNVFKTFYHSITMFFVIFFISLQKSSVPLMLYSDVSDDNTINILILKFMPWYMSKILCSYNVTVT